MRLNMRVGLAARMAVFALLLLSAAHAYHHPGDTAPAPPSKPANPIWNIVGLGILAALLYFAWKVYGYNKKFSSR